MKKKSPNLNIIKASTLLMLSFGVIIVVISMLYISSVLAISGVALVFWGIILLYFTPIKHVPLTLLNAVAFSANSNIERALAEANFSSKGRYLPPAQLRDLESSLLVIPKYPEQDLPTLGELAGQKIFTESDNFLLLTPPGFGLSILFEKEAGTSFTKADLDFVQRKLPEILVEDMALAQTADLKVRNNTMTLELKGSVLQAICNEARTLLRTHTQVGCLLSSAVACVLAKSSGKVVTIEKDELSEDGKTTIMEFKLWDT